MASHFGKIGKRIIITVKHVLHRVIPILLGVKPVYTLQNRF